MSNLCQANLGRNRSCPNDGERYETRPRSDAVVLWVWACSEHAKDLPSWKWKRPSEWQASA